MKDKDYFLNKTQENFPELKFSILTPEMTEFTGSNGDSILLDLGEHAVGIFPLLLIELMFSLMLLFV